MARDVGCTLRLRLLLLLLLLVADAALTVLLAKVVCAGDGPEAFAEGGAAPERG